MTGELPSRMSAAVCRADGGLEIRTLPVPRPGAGEVVLALRACGLCGTDLFKLETGAVAEGQVLGHEVVGTVAATGAGTRDLHEGDRVVVPHHVACGECPLCRRGARTMCPTFKENLLEPGGFAEYVLVGERAVRRAVWRVPTAVGDASAVFLEPAACVLRGVDKAHLPGEGGTALIVGAGSMGLLHVLVLRATRPTLRLVVSDPDPGRRGLASRLGAWAVVGTDPSELADAIARASDGLGADGVFDTVGGARVMATSLAVARAGGTVVLFAHAAAGERADFDLNSAFKRELRIVSTYSGSVDEQRRIADLISARRLDASGLVTHRLPLARIGDAVELATTRRALKVLLTPERG